MIDGQPIDREVTYRREVIYREVIYREVIYREVIYREVVYREVMSRAGTGPWGIGLRLTGGPQGVPARRASAIA